MKRLPDKPHWSDLVDAVLFVAAVLLVLWLVAVLAGAR